LPSLGRAHAALPGALWVALMAATAAAAVAAPSVPAPPKEPARRFGVYAWGFDDSSYTACEGCPDRLNWAADKVAATGSRTIRVYLGARDDYRVNPPQNPEDAGYLLRIVAGAGYPYFPAETAYGQLFSDPRFDTFLLTVYTPADNRGDWLDGWSREEAALEREEIAALGDFLLKSYPRKTFVFLNWEGDNAIHGHAGDVKAWDAYLAWVRARTAGVRAAQAANRGSAARLFAGLEFNLVRRNGAWCGADAALAHRCVLDYVAPRVEVDYYSYSSWETLAIKATDPTASLKRELAASLGYALDLLKRSRPELRPANFLLGEYGFARTAPRYGECRAAAYLQELMGAVRVPDAFGVSYAIFWQVLDNAPAIDLTGGTYGLFHGADGDWTLPGTLFRAALAGGKPPALPADCPRIHACHDDPSRSCGVVNASAGWTAQFSPDSTLSIFGVRFSNAGNAVQVVQGGRRYVLPRDGGAWWESRGQINAALPDGLTSGPAFVYVTDARGLDSNGQMLDLEPSAQTSPVSGVPRP
jgi:hypothetical protein